MSAALGSGGEIGGFCGAIQRTPPPVPAGLARRMANRDIVGLGKVGARGRGTRSGHFTRFIFQFCDKL